MKLILLAAMLAIPAICRAAEPDYEGFVRESRARRQRLLDDAVRSFEVATRTMSGEDREKAVAEAEAKIWEYANPDRGFLAPVELHVGSVGTGTLAAVKVVQVVGAHAALVKWDGKLALLKTDTEGLIDDSLIEMEGDFWCSGTHTYSTAIGSTNTVPVIESIDLTEHKQKLIRDLKETEIDGKVTPAEFIGYYNGEARYVTLRGVQGYKLSQLSDDDRKVVKEWIDTQRERKAADRKRAREANKKRKR